MGMSWVAVSRFSFGKNRVEYCHRDTAVVLNKLGVFGMFPVNVIWITIESRSGSQLAACQARRVEELQQKTFSWAAILGR